ncbi:MAG TPA: tape measure protein, partial [Phycisphaeraceae bacterium]
MAFSAGAITGLVTLNTRPLAAALGQAQGMVQSFASRVAGLGGLISGALGGISLGAGLKLAADFEQTQVALEVLLGDAEKARDLIDELQTRAARTPFGIAGLTDATKTLLNFNVAGDQVMSLIDMLSNVAAGNEERLKALALVYGQVASNGKLMGQDLLQFINAGFNPLLLISRRTGESMAELRDRMSRGEIGIDELRQAFVDATSAGGQFYGMNEKQSRTLGGLFGTLQDSVSTALRRVSEELIKGLGLKDLVAATSAAVDRFADRIIGATSAVLAFGRGVAGWVASNRELVTSIGLVTGSVVGLITAFRTLRVTAALAWATVTAPIALTVAGIAAVGTAIALALGEGETWTQRLRDGFGKMATFVVQAGVGAFTAVEVAIQHWDKTWALAKASAELGIVGFFQNVKHLLTVNIPEVLGWLSRNWQDLFAGIFLYTTGVLENLAKNIRAIFTALWEYIRTRGASGFQIDWTPLTEGIHVAIREQLKLTERELTDRERVLIGQVAKLGTELGDAFNERMGPRVQSALAALGLADGNVPGLPGAIPGTESGAVQLARQAARDAADATRRVTAPDKFASLNLVTSAEELALRGRQRAEAIGAVASGKNYDKEQVDQLKRAVGVLEEIAAATATPAQEQVVTIPG